MASIEEKLTPYSIPKFQENWVNKSAVDENSKINVYFFLRGLGASNSAIAQRANLIVRPIESIIKSYITLQKFGIPNKTISNSLYLLERPPAVLIKNHGNLRLDLGIPKERIKYAANLLSRNQKTVRDNFNHHINILKKDINENEARELLLNYPYLIAISQDTFASNVNYLNYLGIRKRKANLLSTKSQTKRKKILWLLKNLFDWDSTQNIKDKKQRLGAQRRELNKVRNLLKNSYGILSWSISHLEREKDKLIRKLN